MEWLNTLIQDWFGVAAATIITTIVIPSIIQIVKIAQKARADRATNLALAKSNLQQQKEIKELRAQSDYYRDSLIKTLDLQIASTLNKKVRAELVALSCEIKSRSGVEVTQTISNETLEAIIKQYQNHKKNKGE